MNCKFCDTPLEKHEAGRCLDAMVESIKTGLKVRSLSDSDKCYVLSERDQQVHGGRVLKLRDYIDVPHYSEDLNCAMELWNEDWWYRQQNGMHFIYDKDLGSTIFAETFALAITRAYAIEKMKETS